MVVKVPSAKAVLSAAASAAATVVLIRSITNDILPHEFRHFLRHNLSSFMSSWITIVIHESEGYHDNKLFSAAEVYLGAKISPSTQRFRAAIPAKQTKIVIAMDKNQQVFDVFDGVQFRWTKINHQIKVPMYNDGGGRDASKTEVAHFELSFRKKHREMVINSYLPYIVSQSQKLKEEQRTLKIHTLMNRRLGGSRKPWISVNLDHPATFETLAMDPEMKDMIIKDLEMFVRRKDFYRRVGKAWKRGYLLYGPPGTGKSSLIAAMANYLNFDIYDLELTDLSFNSELRKLLIGTANRSILVVEDIDCSIDLENRRTKMRAENPVSGQGQEITLSGLLNFIDGLWSSCGDERIIIFTTNHKERLDPALLRPGRMDVHVHMSYCTPSGFKMLASNYLSITDHPLFTEVEGLLPEAKATPAEVAEQLMKTEDPDTTMSMLVEFLKVKTEENVLNANRTEEGSEKDEIVEESIEDGAESKQLKSN